MLPIVPYSCIGILELVVIEIKLELSHDNCPYLQLADKLGNINFTMHCNDFFDLLIFPSPITSDIFDAVSSIFPYKKLNFIRGSTAGNGYIIMDCEDLLCPIAHETSMIVGHNNSLRLGPISFYNQTESFKFISFARSDLKKILLQFKNSDFEVNILSIKEEEELYKIEENLDSQGIPVSTFKKQITSRQQEVFQMVYEQGYYDIPRKTRLQDIAQQLNLSRHAVEKHVRNVENTIMNIVAPMVMTTPQISPSEPLSLLDENE